MTNQPGRGLSTALVWTAAVLGGVHAGFSAYWALGGNWLLRTVGAWAVDLRETSPVAAPLGLGAIALLKLVAAAVPVLVAYGRLPWRRLWRGLSWVGGSFLILYGGVNVVVSGGVLAGVIPSGGGFDRSAMIGHAFLWDPLFTLWGAALVASLAFSRRVRRRPRDLTPNVETRFSTRAGPSIDAQRKRSRTLRTTSRHSPRPY